MTPPTPQRPEPLVVQIEKDMRLRIARGELGAAGRLPSIRQLADELGVSRNTVIEVYERLRAVGLIRARQGSGYYAQDAARGGQGGQGGSSNPHNAEDVTDKLWHLFGESPDTIKLGCGWLPANWREPDETAAAIRHVTRRDAQALSDYSTPLGSPTLRELLQQRLDGLGISAAPSQIMLTTGASHALDLLIRYLLKPGDTVLVESPGYYNLFGLLKLQGIHMVEIRRTAQGPDLDVLERALAKHRPKAFFINSVFQNPTGTSLSPATAHRILQMAERHDFSIIEDDIYADMQSDASLRLATLDQFNRVIYVGSFSKTLSCSLRVGYIVATPALIRNLVNVKMLTSITASRFAEEVVATMLENGSYRKLAERLARRLEGQQIAVQKLMHKAGWDIFGKPVGGMFVWARRPGVEDSATLVDAAARRGISMSAGSIFIASMPTCPWVRINVSYASEAGALAYLARP
ncbi:PLP-dependent aminotransferase family protein [Undibacterium sp. TJN19]|uniref:aminotransferase-like domain-containing protein n=1 Tax=Undibacterium sp. TJN19 TaxID=3413055 RepID=UPI003BF23836